MMMSVMQRMYATRRELDLALDDLRERLPTIVAEYPVGRGFWVAFTSFSDLIVGDASPADVDYAWEQIDAMLAANGMPPLRESPG